MNVEEKAKWMREQINKIPLAKRIPLGSVGVQMMSDEHLLLCGIDVDISKWMEGK